MANSLVPVDKRMIGDQSKPQCGGLLLNAWIEFGAVKCGPWFRKGGFNKSKISNSESTARRGNDRLIELEQFPK